MRRCFVGIRFPSEILKEVARVQKKVDGEFFGKLIEEKNLHLTLKFLGEIDDGTLGEVRKRLGEINFSEFGAALGEVGVFSEQFIRIVWIKVLGDGILSLQKKVDEALSDLFEPERRFMSHLTIARVKTVEDRKKFLEMIEKLKVDNLKFTVDKFYLMESRISAEGLVYSILEEFS